MDVGRVPPGAARPLHERLNAARQREGWSIRETARRLGVPAPTVQGWLSGRHLPTPALRPQFQQLVDLLGLGDTEAAWSRPVRTTRLREDRAPYLGLRPFAATDAELFTGRTAAVRTLAERIARAGTGLVVVVGASGSGKSSLLAAGLVGTACRPDGSLAGWAARVLPADALAAAPASVRLPADCRLLVVDQFEDLLRQPARDRAAVVDRLVHLAEDRVVVLALRSDAFGEAMDVPALRPALSEPFLLGPPTTAELREVVLAPAAAAGVGVDEAVADLVLRDLGPSDAAGQETPLPLVSTALLATWAASDGTRLTVADYLRAGGITSGIERLAEGAYDELPDDDRARVRGLFLRLVHVEPDTVHRESLALSDLAVADRAALQGFVATRMLTSAADAVMISHDALLVRWPRLQAWIDESRDELQAVARLRRAAQLWLDSGQDPAALIPVQRLPIFAQLTDDDPHLLLSPGEREFLAASRQHFTNQLEAERHTSARLRHRGRVAAGLAAVAVALAMVAGLMGGRAEQSAGAARRATLAAESRQVAAEARRVREQDPVMAAQLGLLAPRLAPTREGRSALLDATSWRTPTRWHGTGPAVLAASQDGEVIVRGDGAGVLRVWKAADLPSGPGLSATVDAAGGPLATVAAGVAGARQLAAVGGTGLLEVWDVTAAPRRLASLAAGAGRAWKATAFSPDGTRLAAGDASGAIRLYDLSDPASPALRATFTLPPADGDAVAVSALAFSGDGRILHVAGAEARILRWRTTAGFGALAPLAFAGDRPAMSLAVSPAGDRLAAGLFGRRVLQWQLDGTDATPGPELSGFLGQVPGVAWSRDGRDVLAASEDHTAYRFDARTGKRVETLPGPSPLVSLAVVGDRVLTTNAVGELRVWPATDPLIRTGGSTGYVFTADRASRWLALSTAFDGIVLWDQTRDFRRLPDPTADLGPPVNGLAPGFASGVSLDPSGRYLLAGTTDGRVVSWPLADSGTQAPTITTAVAGQYLGGLAISPDRRLVAAVAMNNGTATALLRVDDAGRLTTVGRLDTPDPYCATFSADSRLVAIPIGANAVQVWSVADPDRPTLVSTIDDLPARPMVATFAPTSRRLAVGLENGQLWVWDLTDEARPTVAFQRGDARGEIYGVNWSPDERTIIAAGGDENVWAWSTTGEESTTQLALSADSGRTNDAIYVSSGTRIAATGANGRVRLWAATTEAAASQLCASRGDPLSAEEWTRFLPGIQPSDPC